MAMPITRRTRQILRDRQSVGFLRFEFPLIYIYIYRYNNMKCFFFFFFKQQRLSEKYLFIYLRDGKQFTNHDYYLLLSVKKIIISIGCLSFIII